MDSYKTNLDTRINKYLSLYEDSFDISSAESWYKYIYQMVDELLRHGLQETDSLFIKQKYAEFRCYFSTANKKKEPGFIKIITAYSNKINSMCEMCEKPGLKMSIGRWEYRLCIEHFIEMSDSNINTKEAYQIPFFQENDQKEYQNILENEYHSLNDESAVRHMAILHHLLKEQKIDKLVIREILAEYFFSHYKGGNYQREEMNYYKKSYFETQTGKTLLPNEHHHYTNNDYLLYYLDKLCK